MRGGGGGEEEWGSRGEVRVRVVSEGRKRMRIG